MWSYIPPFISERSHKSLLKVSMTDFCTCMGTHGSLLERACANVNSISTAFHCAGVIPLPAKSNVSQNRRHRNGRVLKSRQEHFIFRLVPKDVSCIFQPWKIGILLRCTTLPFKLKKAFYNSLFMSEKIKWYKDRWLNLGKVEKLTSDFKWLILI